MIAVDKKKDDIIQFKYTNDERIKCFKQQIDKNTIILSNPWVKGKMTEHNFFLKDTNFKNFIDEDFTPEIHKHHPQDEMKISQAWGNKLAKNNEVMTHNHFHVQWTSLLYFCDSAPLETEVGTFETFKGKIITLAGWIKHWIKPVNKERYTLVWNWDYEYSIS